jgi:hypothetical protein
MEKLKADRTNGKAVTWLTINNLTGNLRQNIVMTKNCSRRGIPGKI